MKLSTLYTRVPEYIEFAWVTSPNATGQSIASNTITTLTLNTKVADTGGLVSAPTSNRFTLPAGTYYFEAHTRYISTSVTPGSIFSLFNVTDSSYIGRSGNVSGPGFGVLFTSTSAVDFRNADCVSTLGGQFTLSGTKDLSLNLLCVNNSTVTNGGAFTNSTANADQRTTIKLWKLK